MLEDEKMSLIFKGRVWKFGDNISTDLMMPGFIYRQRPDMTFKELAKYAMYSNRPGWAEQVIPGDIIVGGNNFGCGSSRLSAGPLKALGISCVLAESIARIFFRNSISMGLPIITAPGITSICNEGDILNVNIENGEINNLTKIKTIKGEPMPEDSPPMQILKAGGIIALLENEYLKKG